MTGDNEAYQRVAKILQEAGGSNPSLSVLNYGIGTIQSQVYNVHGGFEDWAYGASFDTLNINTQCALLDNPKFGLLKTKIAYDNNSNRAFVFLVEAGYSKMPSEGFLGNDLPLTSGDYHSGQWGHVTRNINLCLRFA